MSNSVEAAIQQAAASATATGPATPIVIKEDRSIVVPTAMQQIAVQCDNEANVLHFVCPRNWADIDLAAATLYINVVKPDNSIVAFVCTNVVSSEDTVTFDWVITEHITEVAGKLSFLVCARDPSDPGDGYRWHSNLCDSLFIAPGIVCTVPSDTPDPPHIPLYGTDTTLTKPGVPADAAAVGARLSSLSEKITNLPQADWNQNDSTAADYVKNRPFYTGDPVETVLVEESTVEFAEHNGLYGAEFPSTFEAMVGETYKVSWDGSVYECTCVFIEEASGIGNLSIIGAGSDTGEPFLMGVINGQGMIIYTRDTSGSHTFSISGLVSEVVKIDEKYLPENIATKSEVEAAQTTANNAQFTANNAQSAANAALAKFPLKYSDVVDTPFSAIELPGEVTKYSRSSAKGGTFIKLTLSSTSELTGSGFYKVSSDVFDFEDLSKISYKFKYSSGTSSKLISVDDLEPKVNFSSDHSVFLINRDILFCGSTGTFTITINRRTHSFSVAETGIYSYTSIMSSSHSFVNYIELTKKVSGFIQSSKPVLIPSSTEGSTKKFRITVDDSGLVQSVDKDTGSVYSTMAPAVTAKDNGKFLRVTNGQWAAVAITNAEEVSF